MWSKVDDALADHRKVIAAAERIGGPDGLVVASDLVGLVMGERAPFRREFTGIRGEGVSERIAHSS